MPRWLPCGWKGSVGLIVCLGLAAGVWVERHPLQSRYYLFRLERAADDGQEPWLDKLVSLGSAAVPGLMDRLERDEERACGSARAGLLRLVESWGPSAPETAGLIRHLAKRFPRQSVRGRCASLRIASAGMDDQVPLAPALIALLALAAGETDAAIAAAALPLVEKCWTAASTKEVGEVCRTLAKRSLQDKQPELRARAIQVAMTPQRGLLPDLLALLRDPAPLVRRKAIVAVGGMTEVVSTDDLLHWLHDPDDEVCRLCESMLRGRGLNDQQIRMGRMITDPSPLVRVQVLEVLGHSSAIEPVVWLHRLSHDASPAVRAATLRAAFECTFAEFGDRIEQMADNDPSPTIRQLAHFYLTRPKAQ